MRRPPISSTTIRKLRCAVYTRKSSEEGLDMEFNSLDAQRESCEAYVASQKPEGWVLVSDRYDDGGFSGGTLERPALQRLLADIEAGRVDVIVVYKIDRLSRSLMDFARLVEVFDWKGVEHCVTVRDHDYEYQGRPYKSLSAVASAITGTRWNGWVFFGLKNQRGRP